MALASTSSHGYLISISNSFLSPNSLLSFVINPSSSPFPDKHWSALHIKFLFCRMSYKLTHRIFILVRVTEFYESVTAWLSARLGVFSHYFSTYFWAAVFMYAFWVCHVTDVRPFPLCSFFIQSPLLYSSDHTISNHLSLDSLPLSCHLHSDNELTCSVFSYFSELFYFLIINFLCGSYTFWEF